MRAVRELHRSCMGVACELHASCMGVVWELHGLHASCMGVASELHGSCMGSCVKVAWKDALTAALMCLPRHYVVIHRYMHWAACAHGFRPSHRCKCTIVRCSWIGLLAWRCVTGGGVCVCGGAEPCHCFRDAAIRSLLPSFVFYRICQVSQ
jgi:hypothetical protein